jgi:Nif-specific regulatory protein
MLMSLSRGNVRELEKLVERAVLLSEDDVIHGHHLPPSLQTAEASGTVFRGRLASNLAGVERELILEALKSCRGNMAMAAKAIGVSERIMGLRVRKYGIDIWRFVNNRRKCSFQSASTECISSVVRILFFSSRN